MPSFHKTYCTYHWSKLPELSDIIKSKIDGIIKLMASRLFKINLCDNVDTNFQ